jgi:hypothetical protein
MVTAKVFGIADAKQTTLHKEDVCEEFESLAVRNVRPNFSPTRRCPPETNQEERTPIIHFEEIIAREK